MPANKATAASRLRTKREARGWSREALAARLRAASDEELPGVASLAHMIKEWEVGKHGVSPRYRKLYVAAFGIPEMMLFAEATVGGATVRRPLSAQGALEIAALVEKTDVGAGTLDFLHEETRRLAVDYTRRPPMDVLAEASDLLQHITCLLRKGRQRLAQARALFRSSSELLALSSLLAGDVGRYPDARAYGHAAWLCAEEADSSLHRALVLSAQSKTARWERRYREAANLARHGYEHSPPVEARILLAGQEANALQALGDLAGADAALARAKRARDELAPGDGLSHAWACPRPRQATYALQVALGAGDHAWMLREVAAADQAWNEGDPWVYGTWSQIRIGAGIANVMAADVEGAAEQVGPVLDLPPDLRVVTITGRIGVVERRLAQRRFARSVVALDLRDQIKEFQAGALRQREIVSAENT
jgi:transcriptional regulator with XRE-family HTH domain